MRIQFKKIKYKNILSTGNNFTTIDFDTKPTTLISGTNGSGKSTLLDAIVFGLYGKPFRKVNKGQLINTINNKELLVEIYFQVGGKNYMVKRGMRPVVFEIYQDGQLINQDAAKKDYQEYLETSIIGINYKSFNQIVVLGSATYVPFMELHAGARRDIIEDLLDIQVFSTMGWLAKDQMKETTDDINDNAYQIELNESKIDSARENNEEIRKIKEVEVSKIKERMSVEIDTVESKNDIIDTQDEIIKTLYDDISDKPEEKQKFQDATEKRSDLERQRIAYEKEVAFYHDHDNCPTCKQGIEHDFKQDQINEKNSQKDDIEKGLVETAGVIKTHQDRLNSISKIETQIQNVNFKISEYRAEIKMSKNALVAMKKELDNAQREVDEVDVSKLLKLEKDLEKKQEQRTELLEEREVLNVVRTILQDGGIKARIISQYIPVMNKLINKYLAAFDLFVDFQLDENFNEIIKSRFRDKFSYASFSEGEKMRIDLALLFTWREVAKIKNSLNCNLIIFDETFDSSLDGFGTEEFLKIIRYVVKDANVFVISHKEGLQDKFTNVIRFEKIKGFSRMTS